MKRYTPSGIAMDIAMDENGDIYVNSNIPTRTYNSVEEAVKGKRKDMIEVLDVVSELEGGANQIYFGREGVEEKHSNKANNSEHKVNTKGNPRKSKSKKTPVKKTIKAPDGSKPFVLGDATVEYFDKDPGLVWGEYKAKSC